MGVITRRYDHDWPELDLLGLSGPGVMLQHRLEINEELDSHCFTKNSSNQEALQTRPHWAFCACCTPGKICAP